MENRIIKPSAAPVNTKSLLSFIFNQMERLDNGEIDAQTACAQAKLASQACNILNYEIKRSILNIRLNQIGAGIETSDCRLRQVESKPFDDTTK